MELLPLFLRLTDRRVLVVGAGTVAARKIEALLAAGARVEVVAPSVNPEVEAMAVTIHRRAFVEADVEGAWLVIAATNDSAVNAVVAAACESRRVFVNAVDDPPNASAYFGGLIRRGPFTIAISSRGEAPALTRLLREVIEGALPPDRWITEARALRRKWKAEKTPMESRFGQLVAAILGR
ncbi:MAG: precorrin-2 dehydrogenase/sirohydrochlorin ferrochelatase family protein [Polyangiales bacterium]